MKMKTKIYFMQGANSKLLSEIEGVLIPELSRDASIEVEDVSYYVRSYGIVINGAEITAIIRVN
jgi:hypothetical protein